MVQIQRGEGRGGGGGHKFCRPIKLLVFAMVIVFLTILELE